MHQPQGSHRTKDAQLEGSPMKRHWTLFVTADLDLGTGQRKLVSLSSLFIHIIILVNANPKKKKKKKKKKGSMALGGGSMAQRNQGMAPRHAKNA